MAKKRTVKSERGVTMTEAILFGGEPRARIGTQYIVSTPRNPDGKVFENVEDAGKYFHVQVSLSSRKAVSPRG